MSVANSFDLFNYIKTPDNKIYRNKTDYQKSFDSFAEMVSEFQERKKSRSNNYVDLITLLDKEGEFIELSEVLNQNIFAYRLNFKNAFLELNTHDLNTTPIFISPTVGSEYHPTAQSLMKINPRYQHKTINPDKLTYARFVQYLVNRFRLSVLKDIDISFERLMSSIKIFKEYFKIPEYYEDDIWELISNEQFREYILNNLLVKDKLYKFFANVQKTNLFKKNGMLSDKYHRGFIETVELHESGIIHLHRLQMVPDNYIAVLAYLKELIHRKKKG